MIIEKRNGSYRALIPALADLSAEGPSPDEAVLNLQAAAQAYLESVEIRTLELDAPLSEATVTQPQRIGWRQ